MVPHWKYNFATHLVKIHDTAESQNYMKIWGLHPQEKILLLSVFNDRKCQRKSAQSSKKSQLLISDAHSSRLVLRYVSLFGVLNYYLLIQFLEMSHLRTMLLMMKKLKMNPSLTIKTDMIKRRISMGWTSMWMNIGLYQAWQVL